MRGLIDTGIRRKVDDGDVLALALTDGLSELDGLTDAEAQKGVLAIAVLLLLVRIAGWVLPAGNAADRVFEPLKDVTVNLDYWEINKYNTIKSVPLTTMLALALAVASRVLAREVSADPTWMRELLTRPILPCLARAPTDIDLTTGGNGYAFLKLHRRFGEPLWLDRARAFAMHGIGQVQAARTDIESGVSLPVFMGSAEITNRV